MAGWMIELGRRVTGHKDTPVPDVAGLLFKDDDGPLLESVTNGRGEIVWQSITRQRAVSLIHEVKGCDATRDCAAVRHHEKCPKYTGRRTVDTRVR